MKLNEIKTVTRGEYDLTEGVIPVHLTMTLEQVVSNGGITNSVQYFIMGGLISMFKDGGPARWPRDLNAYEMSTNSNIIEGVKSLSSQEAVDMAQWLLNCLCNPAVFEANPYTSPQMNVVEWVRYVLKKQD